MFPRWRSTVALTLSLTTALGLAACSGDASSQGGNRTLTIAMSGDTLSLDPLNCAPPVYCFPAYDSLVHMASDGSYEPDLATKWDFTDGSHQTLRVNLREGAVFTDGTPLNAEAVVASLNRFLKSATANRSNAVPVSGVKAVDQYTVDISYSTPVTLDYASFQISNQNGFGVISSIAASKNPKILETQTAGIGPYKLDPAATQKGSLYTFVRNEKYFNQAAVKYEKVIIKPIANAASRLSAIQSGQVDWAQNLLASSAATASGSGLNLTKGSNGGTTELILGDRSSGPLADARVRSAISLVIPRADIAKSVFGGYATPTSSLITKGLQGYNAESAGQTEVDATKARQLLAEAGYSNGFALTVYDPSFFDPGHAVGQAIVQPLAKIGIKVNLVADENDPGVVVQNMFSKKYGAIIFTNQGSSTYGTVRTDLSPGGYLNPFGLPLDKQLETAVNTAALAATPEEQAELEQKATAILDNLHVVVPIVSQTSVQATSDAVKSVPESFVTRELNPFGPDTAGAWSATAG